MDGNGKPSWHVSAWKKKTRQYLLMSQIRQVPHLYTASLLSSNSSISWLCFQSVCSEEDGSITDMGRTKLPMKLITRENNRNITFKKRVSGLKKKAYEFATLCDVKACMICFGPEGQQFGSVTWPEESQKVEEIIYEYRSRGAEEQRKRSSDVLGYLMKQKKKAEEELLHWQRENANLLYPSWEKELDDCSEDFLRAIASCVNLKLEMVQKHIEALKGKQIEEMGVLSLGQNTECTNYMIDMNKKIEMDGPQFRPLPISGMQPAFDPQYPEVCYTSTILPRSPSYDFVNFNRIGDNYSMPQSFMPPGYSLRETKESSFYKEDYDLGGLHAGSTDLRSFPLLAGPSSSSSHSQGLPQPGFWPQSMAGLHQPISTFQESGNQLTDFFWQFPSGGNY